MLKGVAGDISLTKVKAMSSGTAPNYNFANGLAAALREWWPACIRTSDMFILRRVLPTRVKSNQREVVGSLFSPPQGNEDSRPL